MLKKEYTGYLGDQVESHPLQNGSFHRLHSEHRQLHVQQVGIFPRCMAGSSQTLPGTSEESKHRDPGRPQDFLLLHTVSGGTERTETNQGGADAMTSPLVLTAAVGSGP